jgi:isoleucyl-tRNA synthetase
LIRVQVVCIGSIAELEELTGVTGLTDIHREKIDHLIIPSKMGKGVLRRVEEVFDCWFESGRYLGSPILQTVLTT